MKLGACEMSVARGRCSLAAKQALCRARRPDGRKMELRLGKAAASTRTSSQHLPLPYQATTKQMVSSGHRTCKAQGARRKAQGAYRIPHTDTAHNIRRARTPQVRWKLGNDLAMLPVTCDMRLQVSAQHAGFARKSCPLRQAPSLPTTTSARPGTR